MIMQSPVKMPPVTHMNGTIDEDFEREIEALIREQQQNRANFDLDRDELNIFRSGSAPPTVERSRTALGSLLGHSAFVDIPPLSHDAGRGTLTEEDIRSHPAYLSYYYSHENLNPRMPPPAVSKEDWRARQRAVGASLFGKIGDRTDSVHGNGNTSSLFSQQPGEREMIEKNLSQRQRREWLEPNGLIGFPDVGLGTRRKSFVDTLQSQEELGHPTPGAGNISRSNSRNAYNIDPLRVSDSQLMQLLNCSEVVGDLQPGATTGLIRVQSIGSSISHSYASALSSSLARSTTPDAQLIRRSASPCLPLVGVRNSDSDKLIAIGSNGFGGASSHMSGSDDLAAAMAGLSLSKDFHMEGESHVQCRPNQEFSNQPELQFNVPDHRQLLQQVFDKSETESLITRPNHFTGYNNISKNNGPLVDVSLPKLTSNGHKNLTKPASHANVYKKDCSEGTSSKGSNGGVQNADISGINFNGLNSKVYSSNHGVPSMLENQLDLDRQYLNKSGNQVGSGFQTPVKDSIYAQYFHGTSDPVVLGATGLDPSLGSSYLGSSYLDYPSYQFPYVGHLNDHQKVLRDMPYLNINRLNHNFFSNGVRVPYPASPISSSVHSPLDSGAPVRQNEHFSRVHSVMRSGGGESMGPWSSENGAVEEGYAPSLLEELKNNKTKSFELSDIVGHVVEFSADQYGSRFIQQKLETASVEEKNKIFPEIFPNAHSLMTDVFGNYVIQKFFEHGTQIQRKQLASQLTGHVLPLSLQMYGCRVIQKALEVVDIDEQTQMVLELDGHIMKCVRDQNGNHVIQKSIECVPQEKIKFIIEAFYGHVVALSMHPYGCRVIQRVLEHSDDPTTQSIMMDEILQSVCKLAQDQYGNYVIQHVLQHGKQEERSAIISKLSGQIVKMSQQKYASNVIEKCLTYGIPEERQLLINEMLGSTDENVPLQAMMKDQFANYVVQKVLETCDDQNRELILSRIKVHLNALKRYTYGKHIVARVEKLVAAGEKRIGTVNSS